MTAKRPWSWASAGMVVHDSASRRQQGVNTSRGVVRIGHVSNLSAFRELTVRQSSRTFSTMGAGDRESWQMGGRTWAIC